MEILLEFLFEFVVGGCIEGAEERALPKGVRIACLVFASLVYVLFTIFFVWLFFDSERVAVKVLAGAIVVFFIGFFMFLWYKVLKK